jgi:hypothetical protein
MILCNLVEDGNVTGDNRQLVLRSLDERQTEALTFGGCDEASGGRIDLLQVFIAGSPPAKKAFCPIQPSAQGWSKAARVCF